MDFRVLGSMSVSAGSEPIRLGGLKEQALLAALLVDAGQVVSTDRLVDTLWGEDVPDTAVKTLRSYVSRLRSHLGDAEVLETVSGGYVFRPEGHDLDAVRFECLLAEARAQRDRGAHSGAVGLLQAALDLWHGPAYHGLDDFEFARLEAARLDELRLEAIEARIDSELELGHHERVIAEAGKMVEEHPLRERLWSALMVALYRSGRQAEALRTYQRARSILVDELGIEPSPGLRDLEHAILLQSDEIAASVGPGRFEVLPETRTSFIGREGEISTIRALLANHRSVTVTGAGGAGKTRLATEAARAMIDRYAQGAVFVGLAAVLDPRLVPTHVASAMGDVGSHADDVTAALVAFLQDRHLLLVIDNCEHLVRPVAGLVDELLSACPGLTVLATSREPVGVAGEVVFRIPPLEVPEPHASPAEQDQSESVRLYTDRVRAFDRAFLIDHESRAAIVSICRTLDGIPLAIELAAARTRTMVPSEIAARMDDRFALLSSETRTAPARHQTLRTAIEWSYDLCTEDAQAVLRRLSVFAGGWPLDAAEAVVADQTVERARVAGLLANLVDRSLVERAVTAGSSRYRLLETIRQFAFEALVKTGEAPTVSRRHCAWFADLAGDVEPGLKDDRQLECLRRLDTEHDNLRAAIGWSLGTSDATLAFRIVGALGWYWFMRGHWHEAWRWVDRCLGHEGDIEPTLWAKVVYATGSIEIIRGKLEPVTGHMGTALELCRRAGDRLGQAWTLHYLGHSVGWAGGEDAVDLMQEGLDIFESLDEPWAVGWSWRYLGQQSSGQEGIDLEKRALDRFLDLGDRWCAAYSLYLIGASYLSAERYQEAVEAEREALDIAAELGDVIWRAHALGRLGIAAFYLRDPRQAERLIGEGLELHRRIGDENCTAILLGYASLVYGSQDRWDEAVGASAESVQLWRKLGNAPAVAAYLGRLAAALAGHGEMREAALLYGATLSPDAPALYLELPWFASEREALEHRLRLELGPRYDVLAAEGASLSLDQACERGSALTRHRP